MNLPEFGCDFLIARCIEEVAQDRVCAGMHVTALLTMVLERLKSPNRFFLTHYWAFRLRAWTMPTFQISFRYARPLTLGSRDRRLPRWPHLQRRTVLLLRSPLAVHQSTEAPSVNPTRAAPNGVSTESAFGLAHFSSGKMRRIWLFVPVRLSCTSTREWTATTFVGSCSSGTMVARQTSLKRFAAAEDPRLSVSAAVATETSLSRSVCEIVTGGNFPGRSWPTATWCVFIFPPPGSTSSLSKDRI
ncbi:hypothetical protein ACVWWR_000484 [Bradyrhizobium sp. LM3.2]